MLWGVKAKVRVNRVNIEHWSWKEADTTEGLNDSKSKSLVLLLH